ncbi:palmitoyltransferase pfa4 [Paramyrothecium foliicola]|nr:palmitoyltransferase pfa4 [Paramyrothecium foliicola]
MAGFNDAPFIQKLAVPTVCLLISFLGYFSQFLFQKSSLDPGPPTRSETYIFNILLLVLWYTYYKAVTVDPGRYVFPETVIEAEGRWCGKCAAPKPARAHHCRFCGRCIPKMDHHCPWTGNCVSMTTFPHFLRFLIYANISLWMLAYLVAQRFHSLWEVRHMPAYLGPTLPALVSLAFLSPICFFTCVALGIMLVNTIRSWIFNCTMIEGWEIDRHEVIAERSGRDFWDITGPDGKKIRFEKLEFPYDIGLFSNMAQAMGTSNVLMWLFPFAGNPKISKDRKGTGWVWAENGFNREPGLWPPPDPDKMRRAGREWPAAKRNLEAEIQDLNLTPEEQKAAFKERQERDLRKRQMLMAELEEVDSYEVMNDDEMHVYDNHGNAEGRDWTNTDGERLRDYGVDEEAEDIETLPEDDIPLGELLRRRRAPRNDPME